VEVLCAGSFMVDIVAPHLPAITPPGGLIYAPQGISINVGGHAANVSVDLVQLGQASVTATGCIGDDMLGRYIQETLGKAGVNSKPQVLADTPTAKNIALTVEGEDRRFIAELAANTLLSTDHVITLLRGRPRILFLGTIGGLRNIDGDLPRVLTAAHAEGATTIVDVIQPTEPDWSHLIRALEHIDVLHLNTTEACLATGVDDLLKAAETLRQQGASTVIVTSAGEGLIALRGKTRITMPAFDVEEVDPTGAGDALCAGLIHSLLTLSDPAGATQSEFMHALLEGQAAGAACVTSPGATTAVTEANVRRLIAKQGARVLSSSTSSL
jgi:sugar/nucleoside kinase (ribokinase family)